VSHAFCLTPRPTQSVTCSWNNSRYPCFATELCQAHDSSCTSSDADLLFAHLAVPPLLCLAHHPLLCLAAPSSCSPPHHLAHHPRILLATPSAPASTLSTTDLLLASVLISLATPSSVSFQWALFVYLFFRPPLPSPFSTPHVWGRQLALLHWTALLPVKDFPPAPPYPVATKGAVLVSLSPATVLPLT